MKLRDLYQKLDSNERGQFAKSVGIAPGYLWQLATQWRGKKPSIDLIARLVGADPRLSLAEVIAEFSVAAAPPTAVNTVAPANAPDSNDRRSDTATAALYTNTLADRRAPAGESN